MRTVLVVGRPSAPDPSDLAPLLRTLVDRGLRVVLLGTEDHRGLAAETGTTFRLLPPVPHRRAPGSRPPGRIETVREALRTLFLYPIAVHWPVVLQVVDEERVDVVLADSLCTAACMLADRPREERPPVVVLGTIPPPHAHPHAAPYGLGLPPGDSVLNTVRNAALHVVSRQMVGPVLREVRERFRSVTGLEMARDTYAAAAKAEVWAQCETDRFEYPSSEPSNIRLVGPLTAMRSQLPDWFDPNDERPIVMVRAAAGIPLADLVVPTISAFAGSDHRVIVTGTTDALVRAAIGGDPGAHVRVAESLPAAQVLPGTAVVVMKGYFVHALHALQQGAPVVGIGIGAEEAETGARLEWHGCGVRVVSEQPTASELRAAVDRVIVDPGYRGAAARIAAQAAKVQSEAVIADLVENIALDGTAAGPSGGGARLGHGAPPSAA